VQCGFLLPITLQPGKEQEYSGTYMLRGSLPASDFHAQGCGTRKQSFLHRRMREGHATGIGRRRRFEIARYGRRT